MIRIEPITSRSPSNILDQARALFRAYGEFLRISGGHALFCFSRLEEEISDLPAAYTENKGEVLLATAGSLAAGCIAYRSLGSSAHPNSCEIKRLFVSPSFRGQGLGKRLITVALDRAQLNGYRTACLDTEPRSMAGAKQIYLDLGFVEDKERSSKSEGDIVIFLKKTLEPELATLPDSSI
ncbi:MAG: GNAT family N-acetyltransferase [Acidobacteriota bacterium]|nr:GNAT family N-acetyltransferase [Acidobacteriota bacterium]